LMDLDLEDQRTGIHAYARETVTAIPLEYTFNRNLKRAFDIIFATVLLLLIFSWLLPLLALLIKLETRGPVFFLQKRISRDGETFSCIKLRTMIVNDRSDLQAARENDDRITRIGKWLRRYHLDELPQLINVLRGEMSVIGPRPYMISEDQQFAAMIPGYHFRNKVKAGISGLAQSYGKFGSAKDLEAIKERVMLDHQYIRNWSLLLDLHIVLRTLLVTFHKNQKVATNLE
jgi:putative colanic acid biosysnthesis UDP-glucose lipid carrier transferase